MEIIKLHKMLTKANIPHKFNDDFFEMKSSGEERFQNAYQIVIYDDKDDILCDAIYHYGSYGFSQGLLEIIGGLTVEENARDSVLGYLTAEEVFKRFKYCYENKTSVYKEVV